MSSDPKRNLDTGEGTPQQVAKKAKTATGALVVHKSSKTTSAIVVASNKAPERTSGLHSPTMLLTGHSGEVFTSKFNPQGNLLASGSFDKAILIWTVYGENENKLSITAHKNAILQVQWTHDSEMLYSASADKTVQVFDTTTGARLRRGREHTGVVNSVALQRERPYLSATGSDDRTVKIWDMRERRHAIHSFDTTYQNLAVEFSADGNQVFVGGIDINLQTLDLRKGEFDSSFDLSGHTDTTTGLRLSPDGNHLLSTAMDNTVRMWDVRPFAPGPSRCVRIFEGATHTFERNLLKVNWSPDGKRVTSGSGDRNVHVWDVTTGRTLYKLPGHRGCVNEVDFHPSEPIILSCSSDKNLYLGELL